MWLRNEVAATSSLPAQLRPLVVCTAQSTHPVRTLTCNTAHTC